jgi:type I restriction enzyme S subunit
MASEWKKRSLREARVSLIDCVHKAPPASVTDYPYVAAPKRLSLVDIADITG